jgi:cytochrome b561
MKIIYGYLDYKPELTIRLEEYQTKLTFWQRRKQIISDATHLLLIAILGATAITGYIVSITQLLRGNW